MIALLCVAATWGHIGVASAPSLEPGLHRGHQLLGAMSHGGHVPLSLPHLSQLQQNEVLLDGLRAYSELGRVPQVGDPFPRWVIRVWGVLEGRHELAPGRFDRWHPRLVGFFEPPDCLGELPDNRWVDSLRHRFELNPGRFTRYHPGLGPLLGRDRDAVCAVVPEPAAWKLLVVGALCAGLLGRSGLRSWCRCC